jgi:hypothetical protein
VECSTYVFSMVSRFLWQVMGNNTVLFLKITHCPSGTFFGSLTFWYIPRAARTAGVTADTDIILRHSQLCIP